MKTDISKKWMTILKDVLVKYPESLVCSLHFHPSDMLMKQLSGKTYVKLKHGAVPKVLPSIDASEMRV